MNNELAAATSAAIVVPKFTTVAPDRAPDAVPHADSPNTALIASTGKGTNRRHFMGDILRQPPAEVAAAAVTQTWRYEGARTDQPRRVNSSERRSAGMPRSVMACVARIFSSAELTSMSAVEPSSEASVFSS